MKKKIVFIIGAGRSGSTLLYKLISLNEQTGFISNYDRKLPHWVPSGLLTRLTRPHLNSKLGMWFKKGGNAYFVNRPWALRLYPMPIEGEFLYSDCSIPLVPDQDYQLTPSARDCLRNRINKMAGLTGAAAFIIKRTANNRRIAVLKEAFPDARYINLVRDGRDVAYSLSQVDWWEKHNVFWAGKKPPQLVKEGWSPLAICANNWVQEVNVSNAGLKNIETEKKLTIRYEDLLSTPIATLKNIFEYLDLELSDNYIQKIKSLDLKQRPPKWKNKWSADDLEEVEKIQSSLLRDLGYI